MKITHSKLLLSFLTSALILMPNPLFALDAALAEPASGAVPAVTSTAAPAANAEMTLALDLSTSGKLLVECAKVKAIVANITPPLSVISPTTATSAQEMLTACEALMKADLSCFNVFTTTKKYCHTEENENIVSSITQIQALMSVAAGVTNACNNFGKAMNIAKMAMSAYTVGCSAAQIACSSKCNAAMKAFSAFEVAADKFATAASTTCVTDVSIACAENAANCPLTSKCPTAETETKALIGTLQPEKAIAGASTASKVKICKVSIPALLGSAVINIGSLAMAQGQSEQCKKDAEAEKARKLAEASCENVANKSRADCACSIEANKNISYCLEEAAKYVDCGKTENTDKPICICKANPRLAGCEGISTALATNSVLGSGNGSSLGSARGPSGTVNNSPTPATVGTNQFPLNKSGNGTDGAASGSGGYGSSAGLSDSGGSATGKAAAAGAGTGSGLSANILDSGGGGGGGGFRSGFGGGDYSANYRSQLKAFANKNGISPKLAGNSWGAQVTGTGSKSNFEKVKAIYQENKITLLGGK
ncbi:MAG: hypothetical protein JNL11_13065 [Bdellovibrionaceae bacterium]|nr:hypothetical protein [Pseudobdellovibrionaceae bacterium]